MGCKSHPFASPLPYGATLTLISPLPRSAWRDSHGAVPSVSRAPAPDARRQRAAHRQWRHPSAARKPASSSRRPLRHRGSSWQFQYNGFTPAEWESIMLQINTLLEQLVHPRPGFEIRYAFQHCLAPCVLECRTRLPQLFPLSLTSTSSASGTTPRSWDLPTSSPAPSNG